MGMTKKPEELLADASAWWDTSIIDIHPGKIAIRGYPIEELIGRVRFPDMIWLMLRGDLPSRGQSDLLEAAMVPGVDHGPHAPSIAIARMAVTCGLPVNGAMASAINVLDDIHGGAGQQCMELYREIDVEAGEDGDLLTVATAVIERHRDAGEKIVPGFGHRFHPVDPRTAPLFALVAKAKAAGDVSGTLRCDRPCGRGGDLGDQEAPHTDEHRRHHCRHLLRAGLRAGARSRILPCRARSAFSRTLGAEAAGPPHHGPHAEGDSVPLQRPGPPKGSPAAGNGAPRLNDMLARFARIFAAALGSEES